MTKEQIEKEAQRRTNKFKVPDNNLIAYENGFVEGADWLLSHQWVSVEDELPPKKNRSDYSDRVIISTEHLIISASCYDYNKHRWLCGYAVTHWMPIPPLAEEGGEK